MQGQLQVKSPLNPVFGEYFCVLVGFELKYYANADDAKSKTNEKDHTDVVTLLEWDGKTILSSYEHGFLIESSNGTKYQALAPDDAQKEQWLNVNGHIAVAKSAKGKLEKGIITQDEYEHIINSDSAAVMAWTNYEGNEDGEDLEAEMRQMPLLVKNLDTGESTHVAVGQLTSPSVRGLFDEPDYDTFGKHAQTTLVTVDEDGAMEDGGAGHGSKGGLELIKLSMDNFKLCKLLGKGAFGTVLLCEIRSAVITPSSKAYNSDIYDLVMKTGTRHYAIKVLRKLEMSSYTKHRTQLERQIMARVHHPFIASLKFSFQTDDKLYLGMEFFQGGDIFHHLRRDRRRRGLGMTRSRFYAAELVCALGHLHSHHIVYRDLKPSNVMLDVLGHIRLVDFGLCKQQVMKRTDARTFVGTRAYVAPEVIRMNFKYSWLADTRTAGPKQKGYGAACDWWSLGILMYEMLLGETPFDGSTPQMTFDNILNQNPHYPSKMPPDALDILQQLLCKDPNKRLGRYPGLRYPCSVKEHPFFKSIRWSQLERMELKPPWAPSLNGTPTDMRYVDYEFQHAKPQDLPSKKKLTSDERRREHFENFTYVLRVPSEHDFDPASAGGGKKGTEASAPSASIPIPSSNSKPSSSRAAGATPNAKTTASGAGANSGAADDAAITSGDKEAGKARGGKVNMAAAPAVAGFMSPDLGAPSTSKTSHGSNSESDATSEAEPPPPPPTSS